MIWNNSEFLWKPGFKINSLPHPGSPHWVNETSGRSLDPCCEGHGTVFQFGAIRSHNNSITVQVPSWSIQSQFDFYYASWHKGTLEVIIWTFSVGFTGIFAKMLWGLDEDIKKTRKLMLIFCHLDRESVREKWCTV